MPLLPWSLRSRGFGCIGGCSAFLLRFPSFRARPALRNIPCFLNPRAPCQVPVRAVLRCKEQHLLRSRFLQLEARR